MATTFGKTGGRGATYMTSVVNDKEKGTDHEQEGLHRNGGLYRLRELR